MTFLRAALAPVLLALALLAAPPAAQAADPVRIAFHIDENDPQKMALVLNNVGNVAKHYADQGRPVAIEVVAYGPGLHMLRADTSPVKERIAQMSLAIDALDFTACENTRAAMEAQSGKPVPLLPEAKTTPSGVVRLVELQAEGYAYIRP